MKPDPILDPILNRIRQQWRVSTQKQIAKLIGISETNLSNRKGRGTLIEVVVAWAIKENVDLNKLITGKAHTGRKATEVDKFLDQARVVLEANHPKHTPALESNIEAFYDAVLKDPASTSSVGCVVAQQEPGNKKNQRAPLSVNADVTST